MLVDTRPVPASLDPTEKARLVRLERTVDRAVEVAGKIAGDALATIRDEKLYRLTHTTFDDYVAERWGFSRATAYRMIEAATAPVPRLVEGSSHRETNPQPTEPPEPEPGHPFADQPLPAEYQPMAADAGRLWAEVVDVNHARGHVTLDCSVVVDEYPEPGTRVLVAWER